MLKNFRHYFKFVSVKNKDSASINDSNNEFKNLDLLDNFENNENINEDFIGINILDIMKNIKFINVKLIDKELLL